jgi:hypothetical protein
MCISVFMKDMGTHLYVASLDPEMRFFFPKFIEHSDICFHVLACLCSLVLMRVGESVT